MTVVIVGGLKKINQKTVGGNVMAAVSGIGITGDLRISIYIHTCKYPNFRDREILVFVGGMVVLKYKLEMTITAKQIILDDVWNQAKMDVAKLTNDSENFKCLSDFLEQEHTLYNAKFFGRADKRTSEDV